MIEDATVEELFAVSPLQVREILSGWGGKRNSINQIVTVQNQVHEKTAVVIDWSNNKSNSNLVISALVSSQPAAIIVIGDHTSLENQLIKELSTIEIPLIKLHHSMTYETVHTTFHFILQMKNQGKFSCLLGDSQKETFKHLDVKSPEQLLQDNEHISEHRVFVVDSAFEMMKVENWRFEVNIPARNVLKILKHKIETNSFFHQYERVAVSIDDTFLQFVVFKIGSPNNLYGYLIVQEINGIELTIVEQHYLEQLVPFLQLQIQKELEFKALERKYQQTFFYDLINNNFDSQYEVINQADIWGWDFSDPHQLLLIDIRGIETHLESVMVERIATNVLSPYFKKPLIAEVNQYYLLIFPDKQQMQSSREQREEVKQIATKIKERIEAHFSPSKVRVGIGRLYQSTIDLCRSYQEARMAIELSSLTDQNSPIMHFENLGVVRLLAMMRQELLDDFVQEYLGDLIAFDRDNDGELLETLSTYLTENRHLKATAETLHIHTNTLRYRIKKIENLLRLDLQNADNVLNLMLALKIDAIQQTK